MKVLDTTENDLLEKLFVCASVEHALLEFEDYEHNNTLYKMNGRSTHCFCNYLDRPETLSMILKKSCGESYPYVMYLIKNSLQNYISRESIAKFVSKLQLV